MFCFWLLYAKNQRPAPPVIRSVTKCPPRGRTSKSEKLDQSEGVRTDYFLRVHVCTGVDRDGEFLLLLPAEPVFDFSCRATKNKQTTKRLGNAHFAGRAGGYAHFAGAGRAPDWLRRYSARPRTTIYGFPTTIYGLSTTIYRFSTIIYEFSMFKNTGFKPENEPQGSKIGFDHL